ncbi:hypothetical protein [Planomicrobium okeanokoites]|nr:hypothetical protein [Planomicrobium okeanokoites]
MHTISERVIISSEAALAPPLVGERAAFFDFFADFEAAADKWGFAADK